MSLTNTELIAMSKYYKIPIQGVFMRDQLNYNQPMAGNWILNLQSSKDGNGSHYTALVIDKSDIMYFDSFGGPEFLEIDDFVRPIRKGKRFGQNCWIVQNLDSELCGYYCFGLFMYIKANKGDLLTVANDYINMFGDDTRKNGAILKEFYRTYSTKPNAFIKRRLLPPNIK